MTYESKGTEYGKNKKTREEEPEHGLMEKLWPEMKVPTTKVDGALFLGGKEHLGGIKQKDISGIDYMLCSFPKSGTTWVMDIMAHLSTGGDLSQSYKAPLFDRVPCFDLPQHRKQASGFTPTRVAMCHLWPEMLPRQVWEKSAKIVLVLRNPKSVMVSAFHFFQQMSQSMGPYKGTWNEYFDYAISEHGLYGNWFIHTKKWWPYVTRETVLVVTYEGLLRDLEGNISKISNFMGKETSKATIAAIAKHVQFQSMKDNPMNTSCHCDEPMQRKGIVDDWKNYFTVAQNEQFDEICNEQIQSESDLGKYLYDNIF